MTDQKKVSGLASRNHANASTAKKKEPKFEDIIVFKDDPDEIDQKLVQNRNTSISSGKHNEQIQMKSIDHRPLFNDKYTEQKLRND